MLFEAHEFYTIRESNRAVYLMSYKMFTKKDTVALG